MVPELGFWIAIAIGDGRQRTGSPLQGLAEPRGAGQLLTAVGKGDERHDETCDGDDDEHGDHDEEHLLTVPQAGSFPEQRGDRHADGFGQLDHRAGWVGVVDVHVHEAPLGRGRVSLALEQPDAIDDR